MAFDASVAIGSKFDGSGIDKAKKGLKEVGESANAASQLGEKLKEIGKGLAAAFAVEKIFEFGKNILETGEQLDLMRQKTGIAVETIDKLRQAAQLNGIGLDDLGTGLRKFSIAVSDASHGSKNAVEAFAALKVSATSTKGTGEVLLNVADSFSHMKDGADKAKIATLLFGKAGSDLIPTLNEAREGIEKFTNGFTTDFAARAHAFNDILVQLGEATKKVGISAITEMLPAFQEIAQAFLDLQKGSKGGKETFQDIAEYFRLMAIAGYGFVTVLEDGFDSIFTLLNNFGTTLGKTASDVVQSFSFLGDAAKDVASGNIGDVKKLYAEYSLSQVAADKDLVDQRSKINDDYVQRVQDRQKKLSDFTNNLSKNSLLLGDGTREAILKRQADATKGDTTKRVGSPDTSGLSHGIDAEKKSILELGAQVAKTSEEYGDYQARLSETNAEYAKSKIQADANADVSKKTVGFTKENATAYAALEQQLVAVKNAQIDFQEAQKASFGAGAQEAFHNYLEAARDVAAQSKQLFTQAFAGMEDAIVKFVQTGKLSFTDLANTIEADLIRMAVRQAAVAAVGGSGSIFGSIFSSAATAAVGSTASSGASSGGGYSLGANTQFANGGIMTEYGPVALRKYASGGVASSPQLAVYGEGSKPEAFVPLPDGKSIPVTMKGAQTAQGGNNVVVNVSVGSDGSVDSGGASGEAKGQELGKVISLAVVAELIKQKRPGGLIA